jgi:uncharacterized protein involved in exopolysaccharide biosynthesis
MPAYNELITQRDNLLEEIKRMESRSTKLPDQAPELLRLLLAIMFLRTDLLVLQDQILQFLIDDNALNG